MAGEDAEKAEPTFPGGERQRREENLASDPSFGMVLRLPSTIVATILSKLDPRSLCAVSASCRSFRSCATHTLSFMPSFHLLEIALTLDLLRPLLPPSPHLRSLKLNCSRLDDSSIVYLTRTSLQELWPFDVNFEFNFWFQLAGMFEITESREKKEFRVVAVQRPSNTRSRTLLQISAPSSSNSPAPLHGATATPVAGYLLALVLQSSRPFTDFAATPPHGRWLFLRFCPFPVFHSRCSSRSRSISTSSPTEWRVRDGDGAFRRPECVPASYRSGGRRVRCVLLGSLAYLLLNSCRAFYKPRFFLTYSGILFTWYIYI